MPIPKVVGQWNKAGLNRLTRNMAPWDAGRVPPLGVNDLHRDRVSGLVLTMP